MTDDMRVAVYSELISRSANMRLPYGAVKETAEKCKTSPKTVERIWKRRKDANTPERGVAAVRSRKKGSAQ